LRDVLEIQPGADLAAGIADQRTIGRVKLKLRDKAGAADVSDRQRQRIVTVGRKRVDVDVAKIDRTRDALAGGDGARVRVDELRRRRAEHGQRIRAVEVVGELPYDGVIGSGLRDVLKAQAGADLTGGIAEQAAVGRVELNLRDEAGVADIADRQSERIVIVGGEGVNIDVAQVDRARHALPAGDRARIGIDQRRRGRAEHRQGVVAVEVVGELADDGVVRARLRKVVEIQSRADLAGSVAQQRSIGPEHLQLRHKAGVADVPDRQRKRIVFIRAEGVNVDIAQIDRAGHALAAGDGAGIGVDDLRTGHVHHR
jgi:hypothetical protein